MNNQGNATAHGAATARAARPGHLSANTELDVIDALRRATYRLKGMRDLLASLGSSAHEVDPEALNVLVEAADLAVDDADAAFQRASAEHEAATA